MSLKTENRILLIGWLVGVAVILGMVMSAPFWAWSASTYTDRLGLEMPARGDVGWDDAIRLNHRIQEVAVMPVLDGNFIHSGASVVAGPTGVSVTWTPGSVYISGTSYYLASGTTTVADNICAWLSIVPDPSTGGVTVEQRNGENYTPSGNSNYAQVPMAFLVAEAGNVVRLKDLRHMPYSKFAQDQDLSTTSSPTFAGGKIAGAYDIANGNFSSGVTAPAGTTPTGAPPSGGLFVDTTDKSLRVGVAGKGYDVPLEERVYVVITSPHLLRHRDNQVLYFNNGGPIEITGATIYASEAGVTLVGISAGSSSSDFRPGSGVTLFDSIAPVTAGTSVFVQSFAAGNTVIPADRPVVMQYGVQPVDWIAVELVGRRVGNKP